ncbi:MAG: hypothetical protein M1819_004123 [Sarea resinae]|nr:MAG: hypothetical protein M1819_004123 [Sarea resinae]
MEKISNMDAVDLRRRDDMSMPAGVPDLWHMQRMWWAVMGAVIAFATAVHLLDRVLYRQRIYAANRKLPTPAKPKVFLFCWAATVTAIAREISYASLSPLTLRKITIRSPPLGRAIVIAAHFVVLVVFCFWKFSPDDAEQYEALGWRAGFLTMAQLPLLFLLAGKNNLIGYLTGSSYEKLNWLHRWAARCLLITATIHMGYEFSLDISEDGSISSQVKTDPTTKKGLAAWAILAWIVFSSVAPIRGWNYEFFVLQHLVSYVAFIVMVLVHTPASDHSWVWISIGLYAFDRLSRVAVTLYNNLSIFHPQQRKNGQASSFWACKAEFTALSGSATRITIADPPITWKAGQHMFLSCNSIVPLQSHPFTIASLPQDGKMEFIVRSHRGGTKRIFKHAEKSRGLPTTTVDIRSTQAENVAVEGPYGYIRPLRQFDSVVFFAGSTGATFIVPLMRDIISAWKESHDKTSNNNKSKKRLGFFATPVGAVTRHIRFIWVIKSKDRLDWFSHHLNSAVKDVQALQSEAGMAVDLEISIYITCDDTLTSENKRSEKAVISTNNPPASAHGRIEQFPSQRSSADAEFASDDEKADLKAGQKYQAEHKETVTSRELADDADSLASYSVRGQSRGEASGTCGPNGTCCCTNTIDDEDAITSTSATGENKICTCNCSAPRPTSSFLESRPPLRANSISGTSSDEKDLQSPQQPLASASPSPISQTLHPTITLLSGRPSPKNIIRKTLEQALGESGVVACGPAGLIDDVRNSVAALSDERAVHKGSGAQGVWFRGEEFAF